jgi:hypothetical protein
MKKRAASSALAIVLLTEAASAQSSPPRVAPEPIVVAPPEPAPLPPPSPALRAAKLRDDGNDAMLAMRYPDALAAYQAALELTPEDTRLLYNIARAEQLLGAYPEALTALESFAAHVGSEAKAKVGGLDDLFAELRRRVSTLDLKCSERGARILVGDKIIGVTPLPRMRLAAGAVTLKLELDGFFPEARDIVLPGGGALSLEVSLHRKSTSGQLAISSTPIGALVSVDGHELGTASPRLEVALPAGPHEIRAHHEGFDDARLSLLIAPGALRDVSIPLERSRSVLTRFWFWSAVGVAVAGGVVLTYALTTERGADRGSLPPGRVGGP